MHRSSALLLHTARVNRLLCNLGSQQCTRQSSVQSRLAWGLLAASRWCATPVRICCLRCQQLQVAMTVVEPHLGCLLLQLLRSLVEAVHHAGQQAHIPM